MNTSSTARIFPIYDPKNPPEHPGEEWTRFVCISDTHSHTHYNVPPGDVLLHAGDLSSWGSYPQLAKTVNWLRTLPHPVKVVVAGNHDLCLDEEVELYKSSVVTAAKDMMRNEAALQAGIHYLEYDSAEVTVQNGRTWHFYGSPAAPKYASGSFQYRDIKQGDKIYNRIPSSTEILLTHTPPYGIHDLCKKGTHVGCRSLASHLQSDQLANCRLHVFGHIHEAFGVSIDTLPGGLERVSVNAAIRRSDFPIIVDLRN
ncbi:unnamed protein product [Somion occarium]|uniref:Calcineurin-like phosphoesterase domain-containing protein n=1 Tax=Somion occarium TaxID=3059160 RepID=A0ABP1DFH2_9APHY